MKYLAVAAFMSVIGGNTAAWSVHNGTPLQAMTCIAIVAVWTFALGLQLQRGDDHAAVKVNL